MKIINVCELSICGTAALICGRARLGRLTDLLLGHRCNNQGINVTLVKRLEQIQNVELMADVRVKLMIPIETKYRDFLQSWSINSLDSYKTDNHLMRLDLTLSVKYFSNISVQQKVY